ncbi:MAG TPA: carboxypeptidase-like regulatory domain-containing protein [Vicinamibacterales bacterium]|nr:carboxypeptidase-like regulatory domain-containing protein [Vicinamibacterales bacterium]
MSRHAVLRSLSASFALLLFVAASVCAQTTGAVVGVVKDGQGAVLPGATVTLVSETRGTSIEAQTNGTGDFEFTNIVADRYTIRITLQGFKTTERKNVAVSPGDRVVVGSLVVEIGSIEETVTVAGEAPIIQAQTGERSYTVAREQVENLPNSGRNFASFAALTPGVVSTPATAGTAATVARVGAPSPSGGSATNFMLDGVATIDTGGNGQTLQLNSDAIAEVKVLTSSYQAEFGRMSGLQITGVTKSGSNELRGSVYDIERNSDWNANSWVNVMNGDPKTVAKQRDWGYTIGGPIGKPGGKNKLFFFYAHQYSPRTTGGAVNYFRVPTLLERQGDFSQTRDQNGNLFNLIRDPSSGLPCAATDTRGCFQDGGVLGRIPQARLYQLGLNILKTYPVPNADSLTYNLQTVAPTDTRITQQPLVRVDYQASSRLRLFGKYAGQLATAKPTPGTIPGFNDTFLKFPAVIVPSASVDYTLTPTMVLEGNWGIAQTNQQGAIPNDPVTNRCNVGLCDFPLLYPDAGIAPPGSYQDKTLSATATPYYVNGRVLMAPTYSWGNRVPNAPPNNTYPVFLDMVRTNVVSISVTKLAGKHTIKGGYQLDHSLKVQNLGTAGALPFQGTINFGNDSNNPLDSGYGYANAALGLFSSFAQQNKLLEGHYIYNSNEFFLQDNWKITGKLTLDYGVRFTDQGPQYDTKLQSSNFFPDKWSLSNAPLLNLPGCSVPTVPCPVANRVAVNPVTGGSLGAGSSGLIGTLVPNVGVLTNGIIQAGQGIAKTDYVWPRLAPAPRIGGAYDVSGNQRFVIRGSVGVFFDRPQGQTVFSLIGNPPTGQGSTVRYGTLQTLPSGASVLTPSNLTIFWYDSKLPSSLQWNGGVQMALPWSSSLDVSYVGNHGYNALAQAVIGTTLATGTLDINAPDLGAAFLPSNQDPTVAPGAVPGASARSTDFLRPYRGLGAIFTSWGRFWTQYDSIQTSFNRRFRAGWQAGVNWTWSLRTNGNTSSPLHLQHAADGTLSTWPGQAQADELLKNVGNRPHIFKANFLWQLPGVNGSGGAGNVLAAIANDWQVSGVVTAGSGTPYDVTYSYTTGGANVNLTGSPNYPARIRVIGSPGSGCLSDPYKQFNTAAFAGPTYGSTGTESGANLMSGCADHTVDLSIARTIRVGGNRAIQFRADAFNVFNASIFNGLNARQLTLQMDNPTSQVIQNSQYNADGTLNAARLAPKNAGFGAATGAQANRSVQVQLRLQF